jgi:hypothetical protein
MDGGLMRIGLQDIAIRAHGKKIRRTAMVDK